MELNRDSLIEGNSLILTLSKNVSDNENRFKRINVKKIASLKDLFNKEILKVEFCVNDTKKINEILNLVKKEGKTEVKIKIKDQNKNLVFKLKNKRLVDRKSINNAEKIKIFYTILIKKNLFIGHK